MASLWPLQHDKKIMPMAVHLQGSHRDLTAVLHPTIAGGAKEQNICEILECYFKSQYEVKSYSLN